MIRIGPSVDPDIDGPGAEEAAAGLRAQGHQALAVHCDVRDRAQAVAAAQHASITFGGVDILINNAGLRLSHYSWPLAEQSEAELAALVNLNVLAS